MSYFNSAFTDFLSELKANNNAAWFNENKKTYEKDVKQPFHSFVDLIINKIKMYDSEIMIKSSDAVFRLNRDIRFSPDKTPYKTHVGANISRFGKKDKCYPGFYFQFDPDGIQIYGGAYMLEKNILESTRSHVAENLDEFRTLYSDKNFTHKFGEILGEKNKRLPSQFQNLIATEPLIANKQFYYGANLEKDKIFDDNLPEILMDYYLSCKPLNDFLKLAFY